MTLPASTAKKVPISAWATIGAAAASVLKNQWGILRFTTLNRGPPCDQ
jgi:hypothetical protein